MLPPALAGPLPDNHPDRIGSLSFLGSTPKCSDAALASATWLPPRHCALANYRVWRDRSRYRPDSALATQYLGTSSLARASGGARRKITRRSDVDDQVSPREFWTLSTTDRRCPNKAQRSRLRKRDLSLAALRTPNRRRCGRPGNVFSATVIRVWSSAVVLYKFGKHIPNAMPWDREHATKPLPRQTTATLRPNLANRLCHHITQRIDFAVFDDEQGCDASGMNRRTSIRNSSAHGSGEDRWRIWSEDRGRDSGAM